MFLNLFWFIIKHWTTLKEHFVESVHSEK